MRYGFPNNKTYYYNNSPSITPVNSQNHLDKEALNDTLSTPQESRKQERKQEVNGAEIINIFGLSLHLDDLLLISLLIFLYIENIDDPYLYLCLIFLLLN